MAYPLFFIVKDPQRAKVTQSIKPCFVRGVYFAPCGKQEKRGVADSKKGGSGQLNFFKTLVNTGFLGTHQTLI